LPVEHGDGLIRRPEVVQQDAVKRLTEEALQDRAAAATVNQVVANLAIGKTPQPAGLALNPPTGLVGVQVGRFLGFFRKLFVPGRENVRQPLPSRAQPAGRELGTQVELQDVDELVERDAQAVVAPTGEAHQPVAKGGIGQGVRHDRLDVLLALRAIVAVNRMLGDDRLQVLGQVFDEPRAAAPAALQRSAAARANLQAMLSVFVDPRRRGAMVAGMAIAGAGAFAASATGRRGVGLAVHRNPAGRRAGRNAAERLRLQFGDAPCRGEQRQGDGVGAERVVPARRDPAPRPNRRRRSARPPPTGPTRPNVSPCCAWRGYTRVRAPGARAKSQKSQKILQTGEVLLPVAMRVGPSFGSSTGFSSGALRGGRSRGFGGRAPKDRQRPANAAGV